MFDLRVFDADGTVALELNDIPLKPWEPQLWPLADLGLSDLAGGFIEVTVTKGSGIFAASKASNSTNDGQTLEAWNLLGD
jgi:hypothetical protein